MQSPLVGYVASQAGELTVTIRGERIAAYQDAAVMRPPTRRLGLVTIGKRETSEEVYANSQSRGTVMSYAVDFHTVSTVGLQPSPVADALAGLRANEARYFKNKYDHVFTTEAADDAKATVDWVSGILEQERGLVITSPPLEATEFEVDNVRMAYVFYESGLSINVMYALDDDGKRAVGFKLSDGMEIPEELGTFKFARQKSRLAGTIRGSFFVIKNKY
ncbi:phage tail protein [Actinoplanes subtropicus]|uniref:phage tail protein n=1 Tax=Actinoplanes subtropicus TaxID=543632 RepID=UPI001FDFA281|nr:phage tail protein [Actinoplanes subtropicus]